MASSSDRSEHSPDLVSDPSLAERAAWLDESSGVWTKLIQMLSGESAAVRSIDQASLRPPLEPNPEDGAVALPASIAWLPVRDQNIAAYRFLTMQLAGRREFGTYAAFGRLKPGREQTFLLAEAVRVQHRIALTYPGTVRDTSALAEALLVAWRDDVELSEVRVCDTLLACVIAGRTPPAWLPFGAADVERMLRLLKSLERADASVFDALHVAELLFPHVLRLIDPAALSPETSGAKSAGGDAAANASQLEMSADADNMQPAQSDTREPGGDALAGAGEPGDGASLDPSAATALEAPAEADAISTPRRARKRVPSGQTFDYDEWDHTIADYRRRHCRVHELALPSDSGAFFESTVQRQSELLRQVRRHFERIRPERYRVVRGLEDGEDFDLNALTEARIEARARRTPDTRVYTARVRQTRDVATLFLLDMSASTDQPYAEPGEPPVRSIIDTLKEALVVMSMALDDLGDSYAIYGFSSQGRDQVEVYPVKAFGEPLHAAVKARIGGIAPKYGTRMGAALRHMIKKLATAHARSRHLILLSDGFPQDHEYGPDRRTHTYGIKDTAVALREVTAAGAIPFCITVDRAGNDYLRDMCDASQYMIIDDIHELPKELPKIYRRVVS